MAKRFGRNQKRRLHALLRSCEIALAAEKSFRQQSDARHQEQMARVLRHHMGAGNVPLTVEHFIDPRSMDLIMHAIFDERRENLHCQHRIGPHEMRRLRNSEEREMFGLYLGRAIADQLADALATRRAA